jgi:DNA-binding CsgD family transcriptional regulator
VLHHRSLGRVGLTVVASKRRLVDGLVICRFPSGSSDFILAGMAVAGAGEFVGRVEELARLLGALEQAEQGRPAMVLVSGDAGVGKTRLLTEFAEQARRRGVQVLVGGCLEVGDVGLPYVPLIAALRGFAAEADNDELLAAAAKGLPGLGRLLPELADQPAAETARFNHSLEQLQLFDAVRTLLVHLSKDGLVVLVLEDLHWADASTRELVAFLHQTLRTGRVLVLASCRSDELHRRHPLWPWVAELGRRPGVERLTLGPLSRAELTEHLAGLHGARLSAAALERILARSEGNPFYAEELLAAGADHAEVALPTALAEVLLARVQVLSDAAQQVLRAAAVAGRRVGHQLLATAAGLPEFGIERGLREAVAAHLLVADATTESYAFRHALLQEALYGDLLPSERVRLHATYARLLAQAAETGGHSGVDVGTMIHSAELAYHCLASHDLIGALAASVQAATEAEAVLAPAEALRHLEQALALWEQVPEAAAVVGTDRVELVLRAADAAAGSGAVERAVALTRQVIADIGVSVDPLRAARARERLAHHFRAGHEQEELWLCTQAAELVPEDPPTPLRARVTAALAQALINTGQREEARRWCEQALSVARAVASSGDEADVLVTLALVEEVDDQDKARSLLVEAQQRAASGGHFDIELRALHNLGWLEHGCGNLRAAWTACDQGAERAEQVGLAWSSFGLALRGGRCFFRYVGGDWEASEALAAAVDEHVAALAPELSGDALPVEVGRGRPTVERRLAALRSSYGTHRAFDIWVAHYEAEHAIWRGDLERASSAIQLGLAAVGNTARWAQGEIMLCAAGLAVQATWADRARLAGNAPAVADAVFAGHRLVDRARNVVKPHGRNWHPNADPNNVHIRAWLAKAEAEATRLESRSDPARWQAAVDAFSFSDVYEVARCRWRLAEALLGSGDRERAAVAAREAYQTALRLGASPLQTALEALGQRARLDLGAGAPPAPRGVGLTPREVEVLRLLVAGKSNRQIAETLFISGKTVSVHVTNIFTKLGVHSRLEAAAVARRLGLDEPARETSSS